MAVRKRKWTTRSGEQREAWIVDYTDQQGARHIKTFQRKKDADARHAEVRVDVKAGVHVAPSNSITVVAAGESWIKAAEAAGLERATVKQYREHVDQHIAPFIGGLSSPKSVHRWSANSRISCGPRGDHQQWSARSSEALGHCLLMLKSRGSPRGMQCATSDATGGAARIAMPRNGRRASSRSELTYRHRARSKASSPTRRGGGVRS